MGGIIDYLDDASPEEHAAIAGGIGGLGLAGISALILTLRKNAQKRRAAEREESYQKILADDSREIRMIRPEDASGYIHYK